MLLKTLEDYWLPAGKKIRANHAPEDFIKISFNVESDGRIVGQRKKDGMIKTFGYIVS